jgi:hypothetical protein
MKRANVNNQAAKAVALAVARAMGTGLAAAWVVTAVGAGRAWAVVGRHSRLPNSVAILIAGLKAQGSNKL